MRTEKKITSQFSVLTSQLNKMKPLIIAHRGASHFAPENTLAAFRRAISDSAEGFEFDVQIAKDGVPVVIHDFDLKRLARREGLVKDFTSAELGEIDVGSWFNLRHKARANEAFSAETVPTFAQLLNLSEQPALAGWSSVGKEDSSEHENQPAHAGCSDFLLYVELKFADNEVEKLVETVGEMILQSEFLPQIKLNSFNLKAIKYAKENFPEIRTVALFEPEFRTVFRKQTSIFDAAQMHLADEISLHYSLATRKTVERARARNLPVTIWTVDQAVWVKRALDLGLEAIISNNPARLLAEKRNQTL